MAATIVQSVGGSTGSTVSPTTFTAAFAGVTTAGNTVLLCVGSDAVMSTPSGWTLDRSQVNNAGHYVFRRTSVGETSWAGIAIAGPTAWGLLEVSGLSTSPLDGVNSTGSGTAAATRSTGTTSALVQAAEFCVATFTGSVVGTSSWTSYTNSYVETSDVTTSATGTNVSCAVTTKIVAATTAQECTGTSSASIASTGIVVTYKIAGPVALAYDTTTRWPATAGSTSAATGINAFNHAASASIRGVAVVIMGAATTSLVTDVTYGGVPMVLQQTATDTSEAARIDIYVLTSNVPTGTQAVSLNGCSSVVKWVQVTSVTASTAWTAIGRAAIVNTTTSTNPQVSLVLGSPGVSVGAVQSGNASVLTVPSTGCTAQGNADYGTQVSMAIRRTAVDAAGTVALGFTFATSDDWCAAAVSFAEPTAVTFVDAGQGADAETANAAVPLNEVGAGITAMPPVTAVVPLAELVVGADSLPVAVASAISDAAAAADSMRLAAAVPVSDTGVSTDAVGLAAAVPFGDAGVGVDRVVVAAAVSVSDAAVGGDTAGMVAAVPVADTAAASDSAAVAVVTSLSDVGVAADSSVLSAAVPFSESGAIFDTSAIAATFAVADAGLAADSMTVPVTVALNDTGAAGDTLSGITTTVLLSESGRAIVPSTGSGYRGGYYEGYAFGKPPGGPFSVSVATTAGDVAAGRDTSTVTATTPVGDTGASQDVLAVAVGTSTGDAGASVDTVSVSGAGGMGEVAAGHDSLLLAANVPILDAGTSSSSTTVAAVVPVAEAGAAVDSLAAVRPLALGDSGAFADSLIVDVVVPVGDSGRTADTTIANAAFGMYDVSVVRESTPIGVTLTFDAEAGMASDSPSIAATFAVSDLATGVDSTQPANADVPLNDIATVDDEVVSSFLVELGESATGADSRTTSGVNPIVADGGTATDAMTIAVTVPFSDAAVGDEADLLVLIDTSVLLDGGVSTEALTLAAVAVEVDGGTSIDRMTVAASTSSTDAGTGADSMSTDQDAAHAVTLLDGGLCGTRGMFASGYTHGYAFGKLSLDPFIVAAGSVPCGDVGVASDTLSVSAAVVLSDGGTGSDTIFGVRVFADVGSGVDAVTVEALLVLLDGGGGTDGVAVDLGSFEIVERGRCRDVLDITIPARVDIISQAVVLGAVSSQTTLRGAATVRATPRASISAKILAG